MAAIPTSARSRAASIRSLSASFGRLDRARDGHGGQGTEGESDVASEPDAFWPGSLLGWWAGEDLNLGPLPYRGCFSDRRRPPQPKSAGLSTCPRMTVTVSDRPPDRARGGHDLWAKKARSRLAT